MNMKAIVRGSMGLLVLTLVACGGGGGGGGGNDDDDAGSGYTGSTAPASITDNNVQGIGEDATEAVSRAIDSNLAGSSVPFGVSVTDTSTSALAQVQAINQHVLRTLQTINLPVGLTLDGSFFPAESGYCGGTITVPDNFLSAGVTAAGTITYNNFCLDSGASAYGKMTINGTVTISSAGITSYSNLTVRFENGVSIFCDNSGCSYATVYSGSNGASYQVTNARVSGNNSSGYIVGATYCQSNYGCLTVQTDNPILFDCPSPNAGNPSSGSIVFSSTNGASGTITFNNCTSYTVTYSLTAGGAVNSVSGNW